MSTTSVGQIALDLVVNQKQFKNQMRGINSLASKTGKLLAGAFATKQIIKFGKECLKLGSDLQEVQNVVDVTFPNMTKKVDDFAKSAAGTYGLSETMAKKYTGTFGSMAKAFGFTEKAAYDMGSTLTGLAGDVASFYNLTQDEAYTKLKSVFTGETESLKELGVVMTQSALDSYALANGFGKTTKAMSEAEKVALRYSFVQSKLAAASGDFARTSGSWANQVKVLKLQFESFMASVGQGLINIFTPVLQVINSLIAKLVTLGNAFKSFTEAITGKSQSSISSSLGGVTQKAAEAQGAVSGIGDAAKEAAKKVMGLGKLDELNNISTQSSSGGASIAGTSGAFVSDPISGVDAEQPTVLEKKFAKLTEAFDRFRESASKLTDLIKDGLSWCLENVLKPLGNWALDQAIPAWLDFLSAAFSALCGTLIALQPVWQWTWDNLFEPIAKFAGSVFLKFLQFMTDKLTAFSDWCRKNQNVIQDIAITVGIFFAAWKITTFVEAALTFIITIKNIITAIGGIKGVVTIAKGALSALAAGFNPTTIAIAAVVSAGVLLVKNWDEIKAAAIVLWEKLKKTFSGVGTWFSNVFSQAYQGITKAFSNIGTFFGNVYNTVVSKFKAIGTAVGNAIGGTFKSVMNSVLQTVENTVNKAINFINGAIGIINKIPGVKISKVKTVSLPRLAEGGFVEKNTPQLAVIGDNRHQGEVVAPEDKLEEMAVNAARMASGRGNEQTVSLLMQMLTTLQRQNELLMAILEKEIGISGKDIFNVTREYAKEYMQRTGNPAFEY